MNHNEPTLPSNCAFVVQFRSAAPQTSRECAGRVEHLVSGQATHFDSWTQLQQFIEQTLAGVHEKPP